MSDDGLPHTLKSDLMVALPVPRRIAKDSSDRSRLTFGHLTMLLDDVNAIKDMKGQGFELANTQYDITGNELSGTNKADWDNALERLKGTGKSEKDRLTQEEMTALRVEIELRRVFSEQKRSAFSVTIPSVVKSVGRERRSKPIAFAFGCKVLRDVRNFLQFELLLFLTEFCEEFAMLMKGRPRSHHEIMNELNLLRKTYDDFNAAGERVSGREQARQCYLEICLSVNKAASTPLADNLSRGLRTCADQLSSLGLFQKPDTNANFSDFVKLIGNEFAKPERHHQKTGGASHYAQVASNELQEVIRIVRLVYKLNHWSTFHVSKDITRSLTTDELESIRSQSQKFKVMFTPALSQETNTKIDFRVPEVLTTPDLVALVRRFDSKFCRVLSGTETDMNAFHSTFRTSKGHYQLIRTALAALTNNRIDSLSSELLFIASKRFRVGIALYDSWSRALEMKSVSNVVLHPRTTGTEGEFLTPAKVVSLFYTESSMMTQVDFDDDYNLMSKASLSIGADKGDEPANLIAGVNPKQQEAFMAAIQQYSDCLLRFDLDTSQKTIDGFNNAQEQSPQQSRAGFSKDKFDVLNTPDDAVGHRMSMNPTQLESSDETPHMHLMFVPVLGPILTFIQKRDEYDLFTDPLCMNSHVLTENSCMTLVAVDACNHTVYVYDPTSPDSATIRHERLLAIFVAMLSMSIKFRKPYAVSTYSSANNLSTSFYTTSESKSKKVWFEHLLQVAETIIRDYRNTSPPMLYLNSSKFMASRYYVKYHVSKQKIDKGNVMYMPAEVKQKLVTTPVLSIALSCRYAEFLTANWTPSKSRNETAARLSLSPDGFIKHETGLAGAGSAGGDEAYIDKVVKKIFGSVFRIPTPYVPKLFGKKGNNNGRGKGQGQGPGRGRGRGRGQRQGRGSN